MRPLYPQAIVALVYFSSIVAFADTDAQRQGFQGYLWPDHCVDRVISISSPIWPRHAPIFEHGCTVTVEFQVRVDGSVWFASLDEKDILSNHESISEVSPKECGLRYIRPLLKALIKSEFSQSHLETKCNYEYTYMLEL